MREAADEFDEAVAKQVARLSVTEAFDSKPTFLERIMARFRTVR